MSTLAHRLATLPRPAVRAAAALNSRTSPLRSWLAPLFPDAPDRPVRRWQILAAVAAVVVGTAVSLLRTPGTGALQSIWEEDARDLLSDALNRPLPIRVFRPYVGYFQLGPRLMGEVAGRFPVSWAAAVLSLQGAIVCALLALAVYVASGPLLRRPLPRLLVAAPLLFAPVAENNMSEIYNRPACVQFFLVYAVFWMLLWTPRRRVTRVLLVALFAVAGLSTFLTVLFVPLAAVRLFVRRDWTSALLLAFLFGDGVFQEGLRHYGVTSRTFAPPRYDPVWALKGFAGWAVPHSMLGSTLAWGTSDAFVMPWVVVGAWALLIAFVGLAFTRLTRPAWLLAGVAAIHCVAICCFTDMANGQLTQRYLLMVEMLLFATLTALLLPADPEPDGGDTATAPRRRVLPYLPIATFTVLVLVVSAFNYRHYDTYRSHAPVWTQQVAAATKQCRATGQDKIVIRSAPEPWWSLVLVPCRDLTGGAH